MVCLYQISCSVSKSTSDQNSPVNQITITSTNLSEDGTLLSSQEDELLLLLFNYPNDQPAEQLALEPFTFSRTTRSYTFDIDIKYSDTPKLIALIEIDSSLSPSEIEQKLRQHCLSLIQASKMHDLKAIELLLGDEDLLGIKIIAPNDRLIKFNGTWRMDRYEYQINLAVHQ